MEGLTRPGMEMHQLMETLGSSGIKVKYRVANQRWLGQAGVQLSGEKLKVKTGFEKRKKKITMATFPGGRWGFFFWVWDLWHQ